MRPLVPNPITRSRLDTDFYKFTMGQLVQQFHPRVSVVYGFRNRTRDVRLADHVPVEELREQLDYAMTVPLTNTEQHYIRGTNEYGERMFGEDYIQFLTNMKQYPPYHLEVVDGQFDLEFAGNWAETIYWETQALPIISELYAASQMRGMSRFERDVVFAEGRRRLYDKIQILKKYPYITFCDFATRRRPFFWWHDYTVGVMAEELPRQFLGTSNTYLAMKYGLLPMGTSAHELYMVYAAMSSATDAMLLASHNQVLRDWWDMYKQGLSVALTDTFGSEFFFRDMTEQQARRWKGLRQDSGDPFAFGERAIAFYQSYGIDPREKLIVFSDGLEVDKIVTLAEHFKGRIKVTFGWGTNLANDLGLRTLSLVIKVIEAAGRPTVKLSDNAAKAMGDPEEVARYKRVFGYESAFREECKY